MDVGCGHVSVSGVVVARDDEAVFAVAMTVCMRDHLTRHTSHVTPPPTPPPPPPAPAPPAPAPPAPPPPPSPHPRHRHSCGGEWRDVIAQLQL